MSQGVALSGPRSGSAQMWSAVGTELGLIQVLPLPRKARVGGERGARVHQAAALPTHALLE